MKRSSPSWAGMLGRSVAEAGEEYRARLQQCRRGLASEAVHRLRQAARRLQAGLLLAQAIGPDSATAQAMKTLRHRLSALGDLRDAQVQREWIAAAAPAGSDLGKFPAHLRRREKRLRREAAQALRGGHLNRRVRRTVRRLRQLPRTAAARRAQRARLQGVIRWLRLRAAALQPGSAREMDRLHRARTAFKKYHFALEALPALGRALAAPSRAVRRWHQRLMGEIHDADLLLDRLARWEGRRQGGRGLPAAVPRGFRRRRAQAVAAELRSARQLWQIQRR